MHVYVEVRDECCLAFEPLSTLFWVFEVYLLYFYVPVLPACPSVHHMRAWCLQRSGDPLELKFWIVEKHCVGARI